MKGRFSLLGAALGIALSGCATSPSGHSVTIHVMTAPSSWTAGFTITHAGTYSYNLTFAPHCVPILGFELLSSKGVVSVVRGPDLYAEPSERIPAHETGSVRLSSGKWKGVSGDGDPGGPQISPPAPSAQLPIGGYWAAGCTWSLVLTSTS
jgi:hypothetical protein